MKEVWAMSGGNTGDLPIRSNVLSFARFAELVTYWLSPRLVHT